MLFCAAGVVVSRDGGNLENRSRHKASVETGSSFELCKVSFRKEGELGSIIDTLFSYDLLDFLTFRIRMISCFSSSLSLLFFSLSLFFNTQISSLIAVIKNETRKRNLRCGV